MDVFVQPSRYANFSNSILEALACGLPFIGSDGGGNRTLASFGTARLFEPGSVASLAQTLQKAWNERSELRSRGHAASSEVRKRYTWAASAERLEDVMLSCLGIRK
jgi:glycosyltransferase involved in cell wall biosynthesis